MKSEVLERMDFIDWDKPQLLEGSHGQIVISNGEHFEDGFTGTYLAGGLSVDELFYTSYNWNKSAFKPVQLPLTIKFSKDGEKL